jgi:hypothetical protein
MATERASGQATDQDTGLPLVEAARRLGVTENALRKRAQRGSVAAAKGTDGLWYVFLDGLAGRVDGQAMEPSAGLAARLPGLATATPTARPDRTDDLIASLHSEVDFLRGEVTARSEELRRKDHIIAGFIERLPELAAGEGDPTTHRSAPGAAERADAGPDDQGSLWRRWWRRVTEGP